MKKEIEDLRDKLYGLSPYDLASANDDLYREKIDEALLSYELGSEEEVKCICSCGNEHLRPKQELD